jgi:hypothetical protein
MAQALTPLLDRVEGLVRRLVLLSDARTWGQPAMQNPPEAVRAFLASVGRQARVTQRLIERQGLLPELQEAKKQLQALGEAGPQMQQLLQQWLKRSRLALAADSRRGIKRWLAIKVGSNSTPGCRPSVCPTGQRLCCHGGHR